MKADAKTEAAAVACLEAFAESYAHRDMERYLGLFSADPDMRAIGTGTDERRVGLEELRDQIERDWSQAEKAVPRFSRIAVSAAGPVAWLAAQMDVELIVDGEPLSLVGRFTAVLEQRGERWLFAQAHFSLPAGGQDEGTSWPTSIEAVATSVRAERPDLSPHSAPDGTVTILFSDIEGSTRMTQRLGDLPWVELLREHNAIVRGHLADHGGYEVKSEGDGFMLAFQSARQALGCAVDVQRAFARRNDSAEEPIRIRMGLHTGEAIKEADDFFGLHVILASRIADQARGGQILVSSRLKELAEKAGESRFGPERRAELKGLTGSHCMFEVRWETG